MVLKAEMRALTAAYRQQRVVPESVDIVFTGPPGPEANAFVEVEDVNGKSITVGEWLRRDDGYWVLRISAALAPPADEGAK
jgi:hypothetical protein